MTEHAPREERLGKNTPNLSAHHSLLHILFLPDWLWSSFFQIYLYSECLLGSNIQFPEKACCFFFFLVWTIFKAFIEFVTIFLLFYVFWWFFFLALRHVGS